MWELQGSEPLGWDVRASNHFDPAREANDLEPLWHQVVPREGLGKLSTSLAIVTDQIGVQIELLDASGQIVNVNHRVLHQIGSRR